jgi:hypothetical protein
MNDPTANCGVPKTDTRFQNEASFGELAPKGYWKSEESSDIFLDILQNWN